jgi:hypothetical protein
MTRKFYVVLTLLIAVCFFAPLTQADEAKKAPKFFITVKDKPNLSASPIKIASKDNGTFTMANFINDTNVFIQNIEIGDRIEVVLDDKNLLEIKEIKTLEKPTTKKERLLALMLGFVSLFLLAVWVSKGSPEKYIIGLDKRYSNSKTQVVLWFGSLWVVYLATLGLRFSVLGWDFLGGVEISENLLALSGLSALTYGAAKVITSQNNTKLDDGTPKFPDKAKKMDGKPPTPKFPDDLFHEDDGETLDLGDSQMLFVTLLAVIIFFLTSFNYMGWIEYAATVDMPDVDTTLLSAFGLGQGAYLIKKNATSK